jgi:hypothetical protein
MMRTDESWRLEKGVKVEDVVIIGFFGVIWLCLGFKSWLRFCTEIWVR